MTAGAVCLASYCNDVINECIDEINRIYHWPWLLFLRGSYMFCLAVPEEEVLTSSAVLQGWAHTESLKRSAKLANVIPSTARLPVLSRRGTIASRDPFIC